MSEQLIVKIGAKTKEFDDALDQVKGGADELEKKLKTVAMASAVAFAALTAQVGFSVKAFASQERASRELTLSLQNQGIYSKDLVKQYRDAAAAVSKKTGVDNDAIVKGQAMLQTMIGQTKITPELTKSVVDLAEKTGSLDSAFDLVGKAVNGQTKGLKALGIEIDEHGTKAQRMGRITEALSQRLGGAAEEANKGLDSIRGLTNAIGSAQKQLGERFAPAVEFGIRALTEFIEPAEDASGAAADLKAAAIVAGLALTGIGTAAPAVIIGLAQVKAAVAALNIQLTATRVLLGALGIGLVVGALSALAANWEKVSTAVINTTRAILGLKATAKESVEDLRKKVADTRREMEILRDIVNDAGRSRFAGKTAKDLDLVQRKLAAYETQLAAAEQAEKAAADAEAARTKKKNELADQLESRRIAREKAEQELAVMDAERAAQALIELKRAEIDVLKKLEDDKYKSVRDSLEQHLEQIRERQALAAKEDLQRREILQNELLAKNREYLAMTEAQQKDFLQREYEQNQGQITALANVEQIAARARLKRQIEQNNAYLLNQRLFGEAYAEIFRAMHSDVVLGSKQAFGELAILQSSSNAELKAIGKAAAIANIVMRTAESAMNIYAGFSVIPFVGHALGLAGAGAAIAFGAEQIGRVTAAARGALVEGGIPGVDSVPILAQRGEIVAPRTNFEEVIGSVRAQREAQRLGAPIGQSDGESGMAHVGISLLGDLAEYVELKILERRRIGVSLLPAGAV